MTDLTPQSLEETQNSIVITKEFVKTVAAALDEEKHEEVLPLVEELHSADLADLIESLDYHRRSVLIEILRPAFDVDVILHLEHPFEQEVIELLGIDKVAKMLSTLESGDALYVVESLDDTLKAQLFGALSYKQRAMIEEGLSFDENSAGRLMQRELVALPGHWRVQDTLNYLRKTPDLPSSIYKIFIIDKSHKPVGYVRMSDLVREDLQTQLADIMVEEMHPLYIEMPQKEVLYIFRQYALASAPVVDGEGRLVGIITLDDIVVVMDAEAEKELYGISRATGADFYNNIWANAQSRLRWLIVTAGTSIISSFTVAQFEAALQTKVALAILMSIVATMGGTVGMQVSAVTIRALAMNELRPGFIQKRVFKEASVALITGLISGLLLGIISWMWFKEFTLGVLFATSVFFNMIWSGLTGVLIPVGLDRLGFDPAISSATFVIMMADIIGYMAFLGLASMLIV